jgi:hypothetical protein
MQDLFLQAVGLGLLVGGVWWGHRRWIEPREHGLDFQGRGLLLLLVLTLMGGLIGGPFWWLDAPQSFVWDLPPLAGRMLASAGWSFSVVSILALERPARRRVRLVLLLLAVYLAPLAAAIVLFHLDRFDFSAPITYGFFLIAVSMLAVTLWYLFRPPVVAADALPDARPSHSLVRGWLGIVAVLTGVWGLALFVADSGPAPFVWVWPGDLLTSRLIGVMLLAIAVGAATGLRHADTSRMMLWMTLTYGMGLAAASVWNTFAGKPVPLSYLIVFGLVGLISTALLVKSRMPDDGSRDRLAQ